MKYSLLIISLLVSLVSFTQPNCQVYKYNGDTLKYKACITAEKRFNHYQFSRFYQEALDEALAIDSTFAFAYRAKSTAYLKSGDFITWMALMNKAVMYDSIGQLDYRGWCRYQFFRDYEGAIRDIELLDELVDYDIGYSINGDYHLNVAKGLCYKALGQKDKAIQIIESHLKTITDFPGIYDYLHLGVLYFETGNYKKAIECLKKQQKENDLADNRYYIAKTFKAMNQASAYQASAYQENIIKSLEMYENGIKMFDPYVEPMDKVFLQDIKFEIESIY